MSSATNIAVLGEISPIDLGKPIMMLKRIQRSFLAAGFLTLYSAGFLHAAPLPEPLPLVRRAADSQDLRSRGPCHSSAGGYGILLAAA